jgi:hyperosmotically inducible periplasmic protein
MTIREVVQAMRRYLPLLSLLIPMVFSGCAMALYGGVAVAEDERKVGTLLADKVIEAKIEEALLNDDATKLRNISTFCFNGFVYLVGEYETESEKEKTLALAREVKGVKSVESYLLLKANDPLCGRSNNLALTATVKVKLIGDKDILAFDVEIKSVQCRVVLLGIVRSQQEIDKAIAHAKSTKGVREVISFLQALP